MARGLGVVQSSLVAEVESAGFALVVAPGASGSKKISRRRAAHALVERGGFQTARDRESGRLVLYAAGSSPDWDLIAARAVELDSGGGDVSALTSEVERLRSELVAERSRPVPEDQSVTVAALREEDAALRAAAAPVPTLDGFDNDALVAEIIARNSEGTDYLDRPQLARLLAEIAAAFARDYDNGGDVERAELRADYAASVGALLAAAQQAGLAPEPTGSGYVMRNHSEFLNDSGAAVYAFTLAPPGIADVSEDDPRIVVTHHPEEPYFKWHSATPDGVIYKYGRSEDDARKHGAHHLRVLGWHERTGGWDSYH